MAKHVIVGCAGLPHGIGWSRYFQRLPYLEVSSLHAGPVRPAVLRRWRESAKHPRAFGVVAPAIITHTPGPRGYGPKGWPVEGRAHLAGGFRASEVVAEGVTALAGACDALDAGVAIFRSPPDFSPSQGNRDTLRRFFGEVATAERLGGRVRVWQPAGLWEPPAIHAFARELGVIAGLDPLGADPEGRFASFWAGLGGGEEAYYVISGIGRSRRRTSNDDLEELAELAARHDRAWVVFATVEPFPDAIRFSRLVTDHAAEAEMLDDGPDDENDSDAADDPDD